MTRVTEIKKVKVRDACENPVYLCWKNLPGGWDYWLFSYDQTSSLETESMGNYRPVYDSLATSQGVLSVLRKKGREGLTLTADQLTDNEITVLRKIALSPKVLMLVSWDQDASPAVAPVWQEVLVQDGSIGSFQTRGALHKISFDIQLPEIFTIGN